ncbi:MAG: hybrid sensor histidine kinase/response regulator [Gammaproteobacteria bacterium]|nr:hybrid sensor histidine kinase/response regulator [Gammaproteobacteria bacterium]
MVPSSCEYVCRSKARGHGDRIVVEVRRDEAEIVVSVSDIGVGIPPEMLEQVFELFSQVERSSHRTRGGLGMGGLDAAYRAHRMGSGGDRARGRQAGFHQHLVKPVDPDVLRTGLAQ